MLIVITAVVACLALGLLHWRLSRTASPYPGALLPAAWVLITIVLIARGEVEGARYLGAAVVTIVLLRMWGEGRTARAARVGATK